MKAEFGDSVHKELLTIVVVLFVASAALIVRMGPVESLDTITIVIAL